MDQNVLIILCVYLTQADHSSLAPFSLLCFYPLYIKTVFEDSLKTKSYVFILFK